MYKLLTITSFLILFCMTNVKALSPEPKLSNQAQEERAMNLFLEVRCLVCEGQVIENSNTEFSSDMRKFIRDKISLGASDDEIRGELTKKFGEDILISSNLDKSHFLLWLLPAIFAISIAIWYKIVSKDSRV